MNKNFEPLIIHSCKSLFSYFFSEEHTPAKSDLTVKVDLTFRDILISQLCVSRKRGRECFYIQSITYLTPEQIQKNIKFAESHLNAHEFDMAIMYMNNIERTTEIGYLFRKIVESALNEGMFEHVYERLSSYSQETLFYILIRSYLLNEMFDKAVFPVAKISENNPLRKELFKLIIKEAHEKQNLEKIYDLLPQYAKDASNLYAIKNMTSMGEKLNEVIRHINQISEPKTQEKAFKLAKQYALREGVFEELRSKLPHSYQDKDALENNK